MRRFTSAAFCLLAFASLAGAQPADATKAPTPATQPKATPLPEPKIELIGRGKEEGRRELRMKPTAKSVTVLKTTTTQASETIMPAGIPTQKMTLPGMIATATVTVDEVAASGDFRITSVMSDVKPATTAGIDQMMLDSVKASYLKIEGMATTMTMSDRGFIRSIDISAPNADPILKQMSDSIAQSATQSSVPLPSESVGVGAKWRAPSTVTAMGLKMSMDASYELTELTAERAVIRMTIDQSAKDQQLDLPGVPPGAAKVSTMTGKSTGTMTLITGSAAGLLDMKSDIEMAMSISMQGQSMDMTSKTTMTMKIEPAEAPAKK